MPGLPASEPVQSSPAPPELTLTASSLPAPCGGGRGARLSWRGLPVRIHDFLIDLERRARALFPGESGGAFQTKTFHPAAQFTTQKNIFHRPRNLAGFTGIKEQSGAIRHFRH